MSKLLVALAGLALVAGAAVWLLAGARTPWPAVAGGQTSTLEAVLTPTPGAGRRLPADQGGESR